MMNNRVEIATRLAGRLKEARATKGLSLDALAKLSGVSRSMLSQIERGESSPTVASLWNLTKALNVDFSTLLDQETEPQNSIREIVRNDQVPVIRNRAAGCEFHILSAPDEVGGTEIYDIRFDEGAALESAPHKKGCVEHLTVLEGAVQVVSNGEQAGISVGDTIRYAADVEHSIRATGAARALLIVKNA
jgi:transcriptional regulator with XRE-family HTH domain